jgi:hypothetical protein
MECGMGTALPVHSQAHLNKVARQLNERPRETLQFETPVERLMPVLRRPVEPARQIGHLGSDRSSAPGATTSPPPAHSLRPVAPQIHPRSRPKVAGSSVSALLR